MLIALILHLSYPLLQVQETQWKKKNPVLCSKVVVDKICLHLSFYLALLFIAYGNPLCYLKLSTIEFSCLWDNFWTAQSNLFKHMAHISKTEGKEKKRI